MNIEVVKHDDDDPGPDERAQLCTWLVARRRCKPSMDPASNQLALVACVDLCGKEAATDELN